VGSQLPRPDVGVAATVVQTCHEENSPMVLVRVGGQSIHVGGPGVAFTGTQYKGAARRIGAVAAVRGEEGLQSKTRTGQHAARPCSVLTDHLLGVILKN